mmetsp:Transcript_12101/g.26141  ORF Transcript_12101/g.26141 Transcript_12101/m.26141 type:complete len:333 (-) Transcript_12101:166-1164(-)
MQSRSAASGKADGVDLSSSTALASSTRSRSIARPTRSVQRAHAPTERPLATEAFFASERISRMSNASASSPSTLAPSAPSAALAASADTSMGARKAQASVLHSSASGLSPAVSSSMPGTSSTLFFEKRPPRPLRGGGFAWATSLAVACSDPGSELRVSHSGASTGGALALAESSRREADGASLNRPLSCMAARRRFCSSASFHLVSAAEPATPTTPAAATPLAITTTLPPPALPPTLTASRSSTRPAACASRGSPRIAPPTGTRAGSSNSSVSTMPRAEEASTLRVRRTIAAPAPPRRPTRSWPSGSLADIQTAACFLSTALRRGDPGRARS